MSKKITMIEVGNEIVELDKYLDFIREQAIMGFRRNSKQMKKIAFKEGYNKAKQELIKIVIPQNKLTLKNNDEEYLFLLVKKKDWEEFKRK